MLPVYTIDSRRNDRTASEIEKYFAVSMDASLQNVMAQVVNLQRDR